MIPGKITCPTAWTRKYYGYLTSEAKEAFRSTFTCVDIAQEGISGSRGHAPASDIFHVEAHCGGLKTPTVQFSKRTYLCRVYQITHFLQQT